MLDPLYFLILQLNLLLADSQMIAEKSLPSVVDSISELGSESSPFVSEVLVLATKLENDTSHKVCFYFPTLFPNSQFKVLLQ